MNLYTKEQTESLHEQTFAFTNIEIEDKVMTITLDRAAKKNALHPQMVIEIAYAMHHAHFSKEVWMLVFKAKGNVFCAGADLKAMSGMIEENDSTVPEPTGNLLIGELFNKIHKPVISVVEGNVYAGGFLILAGSTYVIANEGIKLGLPEVKRGLFPYQVMASLLRVIQPRKVIDWCIRGYNLPVDTAKEWGLVTHMSSGENSDEILAGLIAELKENSPAAIRLGLEAFDHIMAAESEHAYLSEMLFKTIGTKDGQEGLMAFRQKRKPEWTGE